MTTIPSISSVVAGARFTASLYNNIKACIDFLFDTPHCSAYNAAGVSCTTSTSTLLPWDTEVDDTDSMHSLVTNTSRIIFVTPGRYHVLIYTAMPNVATVWSQYRVNIRLNSAGSSSGGTSLRTFLFDTPGGASQDFISTIERVFAASDYIEIFLLQTSGATRVTDGSGQFATGIQVRMIGLT